jgi:hypothetical protein
MCGVAAEVSDNRLLVRWTPSGNSDVIGYQVYCAPAEPSDGSACSASALASKIADISREKEDEIEQLKFTHDELVTNLKTRSKKGRSGSPSWPTACPRSKFPL